MDYLAGKSRLDYDSYNAVFTIKAEEDIEKVLSKTLKSDKAFENKKFLLYDELFQLDGCSGQRMANFLENYMLNLLDFYFCLNN